MATRRAGPPPGSHSGVAQQPGVATQKGGLVDGPVYRSIFGNLKYIRLYEPDEPDEPEALNDGSIVCHDDFSDDSTNEPVMDGTANLAYLLSARAPSRESRGSEAHVDARGEGADGGLVPRV